MSAKKFINTQIVRCLSEPTQKKVIMSGNLLMKFVPLRWFCEWKEIEAFPYLKSHSTPSIYISVFNRTIRRISKLHLVLFVVVLVHRLRSTSFEVASSKVPTRVMNTIPSLQQATSSHVYNGKESEIVVVTKFHHSNAHWGFSVSLPRLALLKLSEKKENKISQHSQRAASVLMKYF